MLTIGSLFSGYGGLDLAAEAFFGARTVWHCEYDDAPARILAHHYPDVPNLHDVTEVDWSQVEPVDILTGGYPCQPFSAAGQRKGTNDERHLWPYVREAIRVLRPRFTLLENVAGHRTLGFDRVLGDMAEDGLHVRWTSVRASDIGACHRRERLFILVSDAESFGWDEGWAESAGVVGGHDAAVGGGASIAFLPTPRTTDGHGPGVHGHGGQDLRTTVTFLPTPSASDGSGGGAHPDKRVGHSRQVIDAVLVDDVWGKYGDAIRRAEQASGRPAPAPTVLNRNGNPQLNAAFAEWMMMLPEGWVTDPVIGLSRNQQLKAIGNGVVPAQAFAALRLLMDVG